MDEYAFENEEISEICSVSDVKEDLSISIDRKTHPPLFYRHGWTKCVPICHRKNQLRPSMAIGRNYRLDFEKHLRKTNKFRENVLSTKILDDHYHLIKPTCSKPGKLKVKPDIKTKKTNSDGIVSLMDLMSKNYCKDGAVVMDKKLPKMKDKKEKSLEVQQSSVNFIVSLQEEDKFDPDEQLKMLNDIWKKDNSKYVINEEDGEKIKHYMYQEITNDMYNPFPEKLLKKIKKTRLNQILIKKYRYDIPLLEREIRKIYDVSCRKMILDYVLMDPDELHRLGMTNYCRKFHFTMLIRGPIPWHDKIAIHKEMIKRSLFINRLSILELNNVWKKYSKNLIFSIENLREVGMPIELTFLRKCLDESCEQFRHKLLNEWVIECSNLLAKISDYRHILPANDKKPSSFQIKKFFDCVAVAMSRQLRQIVFKTLKHFMDAIREYKDGNAMETMEYKGNMFVKLPFFVLKAVPVPDSTEISFEPSREECLNTLLSVPRKIIQSVKNIPKAETMFIKDSYIDNF